MDLVRLRFKDISRVAGAEDMGLILLVDEEERRQLVITCDQGMIYQFGLRMEHASVRGQLLPEALWHVVEQLVEPKFRIVISELIEGQYRAQLISETTGNSVGLRASDAVLLSEIAHLPLYIDQRLMAVQSAEYKKNDARVAVPVNTLSRETLAEALEKAIAEENYELASHLRDEIKKRERN